MTVLMVVHGMSVYAPSANVGGRRGALEVAGLATDSAAGIGCALIATGFKLFSFINRSRSLNQQHNNFNQLPPNAF